MQDKFTKDKKIELDYTRSAEVIWVKKRIKAKNWNEYNCMVPGYCFLGEEGGQVIAGFAVAKHIPFDCTEQTSVDLTQTQKYCESENIYPRPFKSEN